MTPRRLLVLLRGLPYESLTYTALRAEQERSLTSVDRLRARQAHYAQKGGA